MSDFDYSGLDLRRPIYVIGEEIWAKTSLNWNQALEKSIPAYDGKLTYREVSIVSSVCLLVG